MDIKVTVKQLFTGDKETKAYVDVIFDDAFVVHGIAVHEKDNKRFLVMPRKNKVNKQGKRMSRNLFHPATKEALSLLQKAVFEEYDKEAAKAESYGKEMKKNV